MKAILSSGNLDTLNIDRVLTLAAIAAFEEMSESEDGVTEEAKKTS